VTEQDRNVSTVPGGMKMDVLMMLYYAAAGRDGRTNQRNLARGVSRAVRLSESEDWAWLQCERDDLAKVDGVVRHLEQLVIRLKRITCCTTE